MGEIMFQKKWLRDISLSILLVSITSCAKNETNAPSPVPVHPAGTSGHPSSIAPAGYQFYQTFAEGDVYARPANHDGVLLPQILILKVLASNNFALTQLEPGRDIPDRCQNTMLQYEAMKKENAPFAQKKFEARMLINLGPLQIQSNQEEMIKEARAGLARSGVRMNLHFADFRFVITELPRKSFAQFFSRGHFAQIQLAKKLQNTLYNQADNFSLAELCDILNPEFKISGDIQDFRRSFDVLLNNNGSFRPR